MNKTEFLQQYIFHYNPYTQMWAAVKREHSDKYFNGTIEDHLIVRHSNIQAIIEYLKGENVSN